MNNPSIFSPTITQKTYFRAIVSIGNCPIVYSTIDSISPFPQPLAGNISGINTICTNNSTNLTLNGYNGTIQWQMSQNNGASFTNLSGVTTSQITTPVLTTTTIFRTAVSNQYCPAIYSAYDTIVVDSVSKAGTLTVNSPVCIGSSSLLSLSGHRGSIQWLQSADSLVWNTASGTANASTFTTSNINSNIWYKAIVTNNVCAADTGLSKKIKIDSASIGGIVTSGISPICTGDSTWLNVTGYRGVIQWQVSFNMGQSYGNVTSNYIGANLPTLYTPKLTSNYVFHTSVKNGVCPVAYSNPDTILVSAATSGGTASAVSPICNHTTTKVYLYSYAGNIQWQSSPDTSNWTDVTAGTNINNTPYTTDTLTSITFYRAKVKSGACPIKYSTIDTVYFTPTLIPTISISMVAGLNPQCMPGDTVYYEATITNGGNSPLYTWYKNNIINGSNKYTYKFIPHNNDKIKCRLTTSYQCPSIAQVYSNLDSITVYPLPSVTLNLPSFQDTVCKTTPAFMISGGNPFGGFYSGVGVYNNAFYPDSVNLGKDTVFYVYTISTTGCTDSIGKPIMVLDCTGIDELDIANNTLVYPNPASDKVSVELPFIIKDAIVSIENLKGEIVYTNTYKLNNANNRFTIEVKGYARGIYFLKIINKKNTIVKKLILD